MLKKLYNRYRLNVEVICYIPNDDMLFSFCSGFYTLHIYFFGPENLQGTIIYLILKSKPFCFLSAFWHPGS